MGPGPEPEPLYNVDTHLGMGAAGAGAEPELEVTLWTLLAVGVRAASCARGTFPIRYQIPMLFSSLQQDTLTSGTS